MKVQIAPPEHHPWIISRLGSMQSAKFVAVEAIDDAGKIHGMVGYDGWAENSVVMTIALENPASFRSLLPMVFTFAFMDLNKGVALTTVASTNKRSMNLCERVGFRQIARVKDGISLGVDYVFYEMRRENCRWIMQRKAA